MNLLKGAFSNNTLTLTKQGGGSVDINFPDMNQMIRFTPFDESTLSVTTSFKWSTNNQIACMSFSKTSNIEYSYDTYVLSNTLIYINREDVSYTDGTSQIYEFPNESASYTNGTIGYDGDDVIDALQNSMDWSMIPDRDYNVALSRFTSNMSGDTLSMRTNVIVDVSEGVISKRSGYDEITILGGTTNPSPGSKESKIYLTMLLPNP